MRTYTEVSDDLTDIDRILLPVPCYGRDHDVLAGLGGLDDQVVTYVHAYMTGVAVATVRPCCEQEIAGLELAETVHRRTGVDLLVGRPRDVDARGLVSHHDEPGAVVSGWPGSAPYVRFPELGDCIADGSLDRLGSARRERVARREPRAS